MDYIGLTDHLKEALSIYAADDQQDLHDSLKDVASEVPVLEARYRRLIQLFKDQGVAEIKPWVQQQITDPQRTYEILEQAIEAMKDLKQRANFEVHLKKFLQSMDIILPNIAANPFEIPAQRFGYLLAKVKDRYKDDTLSISGAGKKVRALINEHLISLGINSKIKPVELMSPRFIKEVEANKSPKAKASEMEHAIRKHCKVHFDEAPALCQKLSEKLESLIQQYKRQLGAALPAALRPPHRGRGRPQGRESPEVRAVLRPDRPARFWQGRRPGRARALGYGAGDPDHRQAEADDRHHQLLGQRPGGQQAQGTALGLAAVLEHRRDRGQERQVPRALSVSRPGSSITRPRWTWHPRPSSCST